MTIEIRNASLEANAKIQRGIEQLDRGKGIPDEQLDAHLSRLRVQQQWLDIAARVDASEGIRQGLQDEKEGRLHPALQALDAFRRKNTIPR
jgi:hypothetical protein